MPIGIRKTRSDATPSRAQLLHLRVRHLHSVEAVRVGAEHGPRVVELRIRSRSRPAVEPGHAEAVRRAQPGLADRLEVAGVEHRLPTRESGPVRQAGRDAQPRGRGLEVRRVLGHRPRSPLVDDEQARRVGQVSVRNPSAPRAAIFAGGATRRRSDVVTATRTSAYRSATSSSGTSRIPRRARRAAPVDANASGSSSGSSKPMPPSPTSSPFDPLRT